MPPMNATTTSAPLQLEGVNGKVQKQTEQSSPFAKRMQPKKKKQSMGQRMIGQCKPTGNSGSSY